MRILLLALLSVTFATPAHALLRIKLNADSANGRCLPAAKGSPREILRNNRIQTQMEDGTSVPSDVDKALSQVIFAIGEIGDGRFASHSGVTYTFGKKDTYSYHESGTYEIHLNPGSENRSKLEDKRYGGIMNRGVLAHELGHFVSNRDNFRILMQYQDYVTTPCHLTDYAKEVFKRWPRDLRMEEFGEVFAAYITQPSLLAGKGSACERARKFMSQLFNETAKNSLSCESRKASLPAR